MKIHLVLGTRPEIIKLAPVIKEILQRKINLQIIHTGQHFSENMDQIFWDLFELPKPAYHLAVRQKTHATMTAEMIVKLEEIFLKEKPDWLIVQGDTNSTLSGALAAAKLPTVKIAHVEAGLRSFDRNMPEEINRILVDKISDLLFPPTELAKEYLLKEGISPLKIVACGNTVKDSLDQQIKTAEKNLSILDKLKIRHGSYVLLTVHRQENTDNQDRLIGILNAILDCSFKRDLEVVFPIHPRTEKILEKLNFEIPSYLKLVPPVGYHEFLVLEKHAKLIATDSGGLQEEACILGVPCITLRENTERPETVNVGSNILAGVKYDGIVDAFSRMLENTQRWSQPYGNGKASVLIVDAIEKHT